MKGQIECQKSGNFVKIGSSRTVEMSQYKTKLIPRKILIELGWQEKQKLVVKKSGKGLIIEDWS